MLEGLWGINPNLIENIPYYISTMPQEYRRELLIETYIETPMDSRFDYNVWKDINFDGDYNVITTDIDTINWSEINNEIIDFQSQILKGINFSDTNRYYFLLFFFSAFKRNPERLERFRVEEWITRCLVDVLVKEPSITPYYPTIKGWSTWSENQPNRRLDYNNSVALSQPEELEIYSNQEKSITIDKLLRRGREYNNNFGLTTTYNSGLYDLFISDCFDLSEVSSENIFSHFIKPVYINSRAYYQNGEDLKQDDLKGYGLTSIKMGKSFDYFKEYWSEFSFLIPIGFLSKNPESLRFMNYSIKSFENLK